MSSEFPPPPPPPPPPAPHEGQADGDDEFEMNWLTAAMANPATVRNSEQMEAVGMRLFEAAAKHAAAHPSPDEELMKTLTERLAALDWTGALDSCGRLLARCLERGDHPGTYQHARRSSGLHRLLGNRTAARASARAATEAARRIENMDLLVGLALENEAVCVLAVGDPREALQLAEEAVLRIGTEPYAELTRAGTLVVRARCRLAVGDLAGTDEDLEASWVPLARMSDSAFLAGAQASLGSWYATRARWHQARGEWHEACESQAAAVERSRGLGLAPQIGFDVAGPRLARDLRDLAALLDEAGRAEAAEPVRVEYRALLGRLHLRDLPGGY